ncbi:hypothetical protein OAJ94_00035 [Deltaproteobacteria bacterium]|nr:hypothetical protein [Deltaproteobacteria bacterium]
MGLLDKAEEYENKPAKAKKVAKAKPAKTAEKAKPAKAKAAVKAKPAKAKAAKASKPQRAKRERVNKSLPDEFVLAGKNNRAAAWFANFCWNWGLLIAALSIIIFSGSDFTWLLIAGLAMPLLNVLIIPMKFGRNFGQFISRTKYVTYKGSKPVFVHAILSNLKTPALFGGLAFLAMSGIGSNTNAGTNTMMLVGSVCCFLYPITEWVFRKFDVNDANQSVWDKIFAAYLVHHVPTGDEKGWLAKLESLGDFGAKRIAKMDEKDTTVDET